jgi:hypothetical protein
MMDVLGGEWGISMTNIVNVRLSDTGMVTLPTPSVFVLAITCQSDAWYGCPPPDDCGAIVGEELLQLPEYEEGPCVAYVQPCCVVDVAVNAMSLEIRNRSVWSVSPTLVTIPGPTNGTVPGAMVSGTVGFALTRGTAPNADALLSDMHIGCTASRGHMCVVMVDLPGLALEIEVKDSTALVVPPVQFVVPNSVAFDSSMSIPFHTVCMNSAGGGTRYPATGSPGDIAVPVLLSELSSASLGSVRVAGGEWTPVCNATECTVRLPAMFGPFGSLGVHSVRVSAELGARDVWSEGTPTVVGDASYDGTVVVSDTGCVHSASSWSSLATNTPEVMDFVEFPSEILTGLTVVSARQLSRLLLDSDSDNALDALQTEMLAARLSVLAGVIPPADLETAFPTAADILAICPTGDSFVWTAIKYDYDSCGGFGDVDIIRLQATFARFNDGMMGLPSCSTWLRY